MNQIQATEPNQILLKKTPGQIIQDILKELRPQLPIQNPIPFFVHNNPIQYWEKQRFEEGLTNSCLLYERSGMELDRKFVREFEDIIIPIISSYLDQGICRWEKPYQASGDGIWNWFQSFIKFSSPLKSNSFERLKSGYALIKTLSAEEFIIHSLTDLMSGADSHSKISFYIKSLLFHFKGWSGMINLLETSPQLFPLNVKKVSLVEWLAILVYVEINLNKGQLGALELNEKLREKRRSEVYKKIEEIKSKEKTFYRGVISKVQKRLAFLKQDGSILCSENTIAQVFFCIDDREESLRRKLEEVNSKIETFGTVGFFGIDVSIKAYDQLIYQPFCPPVIQPRKKADEKLIGGNGSTRNFLRELVSQFNHTRFTVLEPISAIFAPMFYFSSLALRSISSHKYGQLRERALSAPNKSKDFQYEFLPGFNYSIPEKSKIVGDILKSAGLKDSFAEIVLMLAHGATTTNNPFQKSYGCGACSGQSGFPNAKIFSNFANDKEVRKHLCAQGYCIPENTFFIAGHHDTCSDEIAYAGTEELTASQLIKFEELQKSFERALGKHTEDRFNRFDIPKSESAKARSLDWSQPRPEYGHSRVALAFFGPRSITSELNLDGRSFLVSYDPSTDKDGGELEFVLLNALPVCANINLDYFTSGGFPDAFGSGSKLPMNIASGIGLMTGSKSDLKIGLARQMVDKHEVLRLLSFVYCRKEDLERVITKSGRLTNLIRNEWIHLIRIDPVTQQMEAITKEISGELAHELA